ncbi:cytochrome P450 [Peniophora sp. CONT]|nr:cytochrome P450 [Peniophora sp. CONT]
MHAILDLATAHPAALALTCLSLLVILRAAYLLLLSPLADVPGPWYAAVSDLWLTTHVLRLQQCKTVHALFERYGPVVRVGPNQVVFRDGVTAKTVYNNSRFSKSTYYKSLTMNDNDHAMTCLDHSEHAMRKKGYVPHYASANIALFQPELHQYTVDLVEVLEHIGGRDTPDTLNLFRQYLVDVVSSVSFGYHVGALGKWAMDSEDKLVTAIGDFPKRGILRSALPSWLWDLLCRIPHQRWQLFCHADSTMSEFVSARVYEARNQMTSGGSPGFKALVHRLLEHKVAASGAPMPDKDIIAEHMGHLVAGVDTSSTTLSYICWELSRRADIAHKLHAELDAAMPDGKTIPDVIVLQNLPYLNAVIKEGLRLYGAAPSLLPRVVPNSTSRSSAFSESFDLMGYAIPPGTVVATQGWSTNRDASVFPMPDAFAPERWLAATPDMERALMPFGAGTRACGGQNLAQAVLRICVASLSRNFDIVAPAHTDEQSMDIRDSFVIFPAAMKCDLTFYPRHR